MASRVELLKALPKKQRDQLIRALAEKKRRQQEALRVYTPQDHQKPFHESQADRILLRGGNQSGKTLNCAVKEGDHATLQDRYYVIDPRKNRFLFFSLDYNLLAKNIYEKLFEPGAFDVCRECGQVRHVCEDMGFCALDDSTFRDRCIDAPPLIPQRFIKRMAWVDKSRNMPARFELHTGAVMDFRTCDQGREKFQGPQWDRVWGDEEASRDTEIVKEIERGLIKRKGVMAFSATPLAAGVTLWKWAKKAKEEEAKRVQDAIDGRPVPPHPRYADFTLKTTMNRALDEEDIEGFSADMSDEEKAIRLDGGFALSQGVVYQEWDEARHLIQPFKIPKEWSVYTVEDPGSANAYAVLFFAIDPEDNWYVFDELYEQRPTLLEMIEKQKLKLNHTTGWVEKPDFGNIHQPQRALIDPASNQVHIGSRKSMSTKDQLQRLRKKRLEAYEGGPMLAPARNAVQPGIFAVKALLKDITHDKNGNPLPAQKRHPKLRVFTTCRNFRREVELYRWPRAHGDKDIQENSSPLKKDDHLMDCLRYGAMGGLRYVHPMHRPESSLPPGLAKRYKQKKRRIRKQQAKDRASQTSLS